jgi:hypothetical protein
MRKPLFFLLLLIACNSFALEIEKAYRLIPHKQTPFILLQSKIPEPEAEYVARLLSLSELAMAERVAAMKDGPEKSGYISQIDSILWQLGNLETPQNLRPAHQHIQTAIQQHRNYFELHQVRGEKAKAERNQLIQTSHRHLITAYNLLMRLYPQELKHNKQAFFDYLCALDFI